MFLSPATVVSEEWSVAEDPRESAGGKRTAGCSTDQRSLLKRFIEDADLFSSEWHEAEAAAEYAKEFFRAERVRAQTCLRQ